MTTRRGWLWFAAWVGAGILLAFATFASSFGLFLLPLALVSLWAISRGGPPWPTAFGLVSGAGLVCLLIWALNQDYRPCPEDGVLRMPPGATSVECGGVDPQPWLVAGIALTLAGAVAFAAVSRSARAPRVG